MAVVKSGGPPSGTAAWQWVVKAKQESSFNERVVNGIGCVGLWQICPVNFGWLGVTQSELKDPAANFRAAKRVFARQGWAAWKASGGEPKDPTGTMPQDESGPFDVSNPLGSVPNPLDAVADTAGAIAALAGAVGGFFEWVTDPDVWKRVALVVAGGGIVLVGVAAIAGPKLDEITPAAVKAATTKGLVK
jgi:hypothetical protein